MKCTFADADAVDGATLGRRSLEYSFCIGRKLFAAGDAFKVSTVMVVSTTGQQSRGAIFGSNKLLYPQIEAIARNENVELKNRVEDVGMVGEGPGHLEFVSAFHAEGQAMITAWLRRS